MRFSVLSFAALSAAISSVAAIGELGFDLGVKVASGDCKYTADYLSDFETIKSYTDIVRVYSTSDCNTLEYLLPAVKQAGMRVFIGVWPTDDSHFALDKQALTTYITEVDASSIVGITVGSEALYRGDLTPSALADAINEVRDLVHAIDGYESVPVGTADSWNILVDAANSAAVTASDVVLANAFSYWQGQTMANSSHSFFDDIMQALQTIQTAKGSTDISFWIGETGWPTEGQSYESSIPSVDNAATFWQESICAIRAWGINTLVFEAFDETWKPETSGVEGTEQHWGLFAEDGVSPKYSLSCNF
ncbi:glycoside hydrolase superfamily [Dipodascopsis tothii]|uniref:glycoside hydrolase superfamily n=1 Tax=Dipodascopsis tothii TaxID=44089 RepID=UPI0034CEC124